MRRKANPHWGGYFILWMFLLITPCNSVVPMLNDIKNVHELCRANRHLYELRENNSFQLHLRADGLSPTYEKMVLKKLQTKCTLTLKACSACHVFVIIHNMKIPSCSGNCSSSCSYFKFREPLSSYETKRYCGDEKKDLYFESQTKILHFDFVQNLHEKFRVSFTISVKRNLFLYTEKRSEPKYIQTPFFPGGYPSDYEAEYNFQVFNPYGYVQLLFTDFHLSQGSFIEVSGHNGTRVEIFTGASFRPPVFISHHKYLILKFKANQQQPSLGFRAMYKFGLSIGDYPIVKPHTDCGGNKDEYGGAIELRSNSSGGSELYDCIWLITPPLFLQQSVLLAASVTKFQNIEPGSSLEFRKGLISTARLVKFLQCRHSQNCSSLLEKSEVISHSENGFYIRFRGYLQSKSLLLISYYKFQEDNCTKEDFMCHDGKRCINVALVCDGFSHCNDKSDENDCKGLKSTRRTVNTSITVSPPSPVIHPLSKDPIVIALIVLGTLSCITFLLMGVSLVGVCDKYLYSATPRNEASMQNSDVPVFENANDGDQLSIDLSSDFPPTYEAVLQDSSRYPPLFYSRCKTRETSFNYEFCEETHADATSCASSRTISLNLSNQVCYFNNNLHTSVCEDNSQPSTSHLSGTHHSSFNAPLTGLSFDSAERTNHKPYKMENRKHISSSCNDLVNLFPEFLPSRDINLSKRSRFKTFSL